MLRVFSSLDSLHDLHRHKPEKKRPLPCIVSFFHYFPLMVSLNVSVKGWRASIDSYRDDRTK